MQLKLSIKVLFQPDTEAKLRAHVVKAFAKAQPMISTLLQDRMNQAAEHVYGTYASAFYEASSRPDFFELGPTSINIRIRDPMLLRMEAGSEGFDMKPGLLAHAKKTSRKGDPYIDIPILHSNTVGRAAKAGKHEPPRRFQRTVLRQSGNIVQDVMHKASITKGIARRNGVYQTVRRVSTNSAPSSWWHPGFKGAHMVPNVLQSCAGEIKLILQDCLTAQGFK